MLIHAQNQGHPCFGQSVKWVAKVAFWIGTLTKKYSTHSDCYHVIHILFLCSVISCMEVTESKTMCIHLLSEHSYFLYMVVHSAPWI